MSSGRTHDRITLWTLPLVVVLAFRLTLNAWLTVWVCLGFLVGGWMFGPDLDIHSVQYKRWGWLRWIWLPYRSRIRHRSAWSHGPVIGTLIRVIYALLWLSLAGLVGIAVLNGLGQTAITWDALRAGLGEHLRLHWPRWLAMVAGLELGALSHYTADWVSSTWKRHRSGAKTSKTRSKGRSPKRSQKSSPKRSSASRYPVAKVNPAAKSGTEEKPGPTLVNPNDLPPQ
ncbi:metal-binding protein [Leptolyngbya sp. BL0902]|uniref:metal-binding protein n=1 Tax=Leptolyngbya sp. BL0902 TaxID=1115757 RepID=UPI0018E85DFF|nr:metal-binding protein [Leptolyngbya sp. BL0902]QQE63372.1 metal-binding protein [Leptolyngbya sp. BL0902]